MNELLEKLSVSLQKGKAAEVTAYAQQAVAEGETAKDILDAMLTGMSIIGVKFKNNEVFVPEVLIAARAMNSGMDVIKPLLINQGVESAGKVVLGTVKGDLHDIGKNLVRMMMVGNGLEVVDLGVNVPPEKFIAAIEENHPDIVAMSALLTTTMGNMKEVIQAITDRGLRDQVKIRGGGAPVNADFALSIGADKYSPDAATAATDARDLIQPS